MRKVITKEFKFESAHRLFDNNLEKEENEKIFGACGALHGHRWNLFISVSGNETHGMIINFSKLKEIVNKNVIEKLDHNYLNHTEEFKNILSTAENMITVIWNLLVSELQKEGVTLEKIKLYETDTSSCELKNE